MAERLGETVDEFRGAQATGNLDNDPLPSNSLTLPSDEIELNGVAGAPAVLAVPKVITPVSCLDEICMVRKLSIPQYEYKGEVGKTHKKVFTMEVWVCDMDVTETGCGRTKMEAKNEAARRVLEKIREAGKRNESLRLLTSEVVKKCHDMLKKCVLTEPLSKNESKTARTSADALMALENKLRIDRSVYECVDASGPPHNRVFTISCKQGDHVTHGTAKSKQFAKNIAASHMLKILSDLHPKNSS